MSTEIDPRVGQWYEDGEGNTFEVVALDRDCVEVQFYDGTVEEYDRDTWYEMELQIAEPPEDWAGSLDVQRDDYGVDLDYCGPDRRGNPLDDFDI